MDEDYPRTLLELERRFCTEEACVEYLAALRWPGGWACPRCAGADAWSIRRTRCVHDRQIQSHQEEGEHLLPRVHRVIALLKRWLLGTHQGAIGQQHLDTYLDEFTFRFNRRKSKSRGKLFYRLAQQAVQVGPVPFATLVKPQPVVSGGVK
jgi:hypothetical protein